MQAILWVLMAALGAPHKEVDHIYCAEVYPAIVLSKPKQKAKWAHPPDVRICPDSNMNPARLSRAMNYWERLGYKFGAIIIEKDAYNCIAPLPRRQEIVITLPTQEVNSKYLASTRLTTFKSTGEIAHAVIYITPRQSERERVIEHEIGHALGWTHYPQSRHIMNPNWEAGGYDSYGIKNK